VFIASLGIREVTRQAGVVPTSFYRHFRNMDDLGLQLVDHLSDGDLEMTCDLVVRSVAFSLTDLLGVSAEDEYQVEQIRKRTTRFLQLIFVGAAHWDNKRP